MNSGQTPKKRHSRREQPGKNGFSVAKKATRSEVVRIAEFTGKALDHLVQPLTFHEGQVIWLFAQGPHLCVAGWGQ